MLKMTDRPLKIRLHSSINIIELGEIPFKNGITKYYEILDDINRLSSTEYYFDPKYMLMKFNGKGVFNMKGVMHGVDNDFIQDILDIYIDT